MDKILIFAGTTEGRKLAEYCNNNEIPAIVLVATEYGNEILKDLDKIEILSGRKDDTEIEELIKKENIRKIFDATHPFAKIVSENIKRVCIKLENTRNIEYVRVLREESLFASKEENIEFKNDIVLVESIEEAIKYLEDKEGNILVSTGSKELYKYKNLDRKRLFVRVIPSIESLEICKSCNIEASNIIAMQGPFISDMNVATIKQYECKYVVSKDSGKSGGFLDKLEACKLTESKLILIKRPNEEGISLDLALEKIKKLKKIKESIFDSNNLEISIAGSSMGYYENFTLELIKKIEESEVIIGSKRLIELVSKIRKDKVQTKIAYKHEEIAEYIKNDILNKKKILVLMSGDSGFYSGALKLKEELEIYIKQNKLPKDTKIDLLAGISSFSYMCSKFAIDYTDMKILSVHGREENYNSLYDSIKHNEKTFALSSGREQIKKIADDLISLGLEDIDIYVAENMGQIDECYSIVKPKDVKKEYAILTSLIFINKNFKTKSLSFGIKDDEFIRDKVPMTKADVRALAMSKLELTNDAICYDIGAGTGSCSIEMALYASFGKVYAIEKKDIAIDLIDKNIKKFGLHNVVTIHSDISDIIESLETPTHVFIGGTSGKLEEIVDKIYEKNKDAIIVITAVSIESISSIHTVLKKYQDLSYQTEISLINSTNVKQLGKYDMLMANNPVFIGKIKNIF